LILLVQAPAQKAVPAPVAAGDLPVTVTYKGKGTVDATHRVIVFLFSDANVTSNSRPLDTKSASKSGETVTFTGVSGPVYVFAVYDDKGTYDGLSGPPPAGVAVATYRKVPKGPPTAVKPGAPVKFTFDDSERWAK
jgi:hypothetical protein